MEKRRDSIYMRYYKCGNTTHFKLKILLKRIKMYKIYSIVLSVLCLSCGGNPDPEKEGSEVELNRNGDSLSKSQRINATANYFLKGYIE